MYWASENWVVGASLGPWTSMGHIQTNVFAFKIFGQYPHKDHPNSVRLEIQGNIFKEQTINILVAVSHSQWNVNKNKLCLLELQIKYDR